MRTKWTAVLCLLGASTLVAVNASALEPGQAAGPVRFENLDGVQRTMSAENYASRKATVVVFLSGRSEAVLLQMEAMNTLYARIRLDGVLFVGVCSDPNQSGDELRTFLQHTGGIIPLYRDPRGDAAKQFGATVTPEYFMLDANGALVYHGGLGQPGEGLELAIQQHLSGTPVTARAPLAGDPIGAAAPRTPVPDKYGTIYFASHLIFEKIPGAAVHHCSTVAEAPNGDILCLWYGGSYESSEDQALYLARQRRGEAAWEEPQRLLFDPNLPPGNAVLFQGPDRKLWIIWGRMESERPIRRGSGWGECRLMYRTSDDNGVTWSADAEVPDGFGSLPRNLPLTLADGRFAIPMSGEGRQAHGGSYLLFLDPAGPTWARSGYVRGGSQPTVPARFGRAPDADAEQSADSAKPLAGRRRNLVGLRGDGTEKPRLRHLHDPAEERPHPPRLQRHRRRRSHPVQPHSVRRRRRHLDEPAHARGRLGGVFVSQHPAGVRRPDPSHVHLPALFDQTHRIQ